MEMGCIGFLIGAITAIIMIGIGVCFGRSNKDDVERDSKDDIEREHRPDYDITIYVPMRYRRGSRDKRDRKPTPEEIETVLYLLRIGASNHEKEIIDYLIDKEGIHEENVYPGGNHKKTAGRGNSYRTGENGETIRFSRKVARQDRY